MGANHQKEIAFLFESGISIKIEQEIIIDKGEFSRPDRVVEKDGELFIIDFKTGEESEKHRKQLEKYEVLLFQIHGKKAKSYLLYIEKNKIIKFKDVQTIVISSKESQLFQELLHQGRQFLDVKRKTD